jgi:hypothetical protein
MIRKFMVAAAFSAIAAFGLPITATNTRPVTVNGPASGEQSLQYYLNQVYGIGVVNAATDQQTAALWQETGAPPQQIGPTVVAHQASDGDPFGLFSGTNTATATLVDVFTSGAPGGANGSSASIRFNTNGTISVSDSTGIAGHTCAQDYVNCGTFSGISQSDFGFYIVNGAGTTLYTSDSANTSVGGKQAHAVSYMGAGDKWVIAFEDGTDFDYNDRIVTVESITPIPEPAAVVFFGTVLVAFASLRRKKLSL